MADPPSSPATMEPNQPDKPNSNSVPNQSDQLPASSISTPPPPSSTPASVTENPNPNHPSVPTPPPPAILSYTTPPVSFGTVVPPTAPSFRPAPPMFSPLPTAQNMAYQNALNPGVQPPGVSHGPVMVPSVASGAVSATVSVSPMMNYPVPRSPSNQAMRPYMTMLNGYAAMPVPSPQGTLPPPVS